jgi:predicted RNA binding protein YcfA (HicA-like mRNA interferase family)
MSFDSGIAFISPGTRHSWPKSMKVRKLIRLLEDDGWLHMRTRGSHRQFRHSVKPGTVTVAGKPGADVPPGTLRSILKRAGLQEK